MSQPHTLASLTGGGAPTFEQPFEMMEACHQRLDRTLALLARLRAHLRSHGSDAQAQQAAQDILRYFERAAPNHHRDEELHVFPPLLAQGEPGVRVTVEHLKNDHVEMEARWPGVQEILQAIAQGRAEPLDAADDTALDAFAQLYRSHIELEETIAYPRAKALLSEGEQQAMGREMQARRGGPKG